MESMATLKVLVIVHILLNVHTKGDYEIQVRTIFFDNPSQSCMSCRLTGDASETRESCCDNKAMEKGNCNGKERCDSKFVYCLRPLGTQDPQQECSDGKRVSSVNANDDAIDFSNDTVLGLSNPLILHGLTREWSGVQLYITVLDVDTDKDEIIGEFLYDITPSMLQVGGEPYERNDSNAHVTLGIEVTLNCSENFSGEQCSLCAVGFTGEQCETNITDSDCVSNTCQNGQCVGGNDSFVCECDQGFTGVLCEVNIDDCVGVNCSERGQCFDGNNSFSCECDEGYTGNLCETDIDDCIGISCSGHGNCVNGLNLFSCECDPGFTGELCEENIDDCAGVSCSGNGRCEDGLNSFSCLCNSGFIGEHCDQVEEDEDSRNFILYGSMTAGAVLLLLLVFTLLIAVPLTICKRRRKKPKDIRRPSTVRVDEIPPAQQNVYECSEQHDEGIHPPKTNTNKRGHENTTSTHTTWLTESDKLDNKSEYDDNASSCYVLMESHVIALPATRTNNDTMLNPLRGLPQIPVHLTGNYLNRANGGMDPTSPVGEHDYDYID